jgi:mannitol-1-/sugar-/sorbitol-6-/2-deoxyglucose-6-phosphatase
MIDAIIFDMDGVLLDSEPFWQESEMEVFATVGVHLTRAQCIETTGLPVNDVVAYRYNQNPWNKKSLDQVAQEIVSGVELRVRERAVPLEGVTDVLEFFRTRQIPIAVASSSAMLLIQTVLKKLSLEKTFSVVHSAEEEEFGKPHPAVFITTAKHMQVPPANCLVFEDSFNGLIAAKAARMKTVVLPIAEQWNETRFDIADLKLQSMKEFSEQQWAFLNKDF